MSRPVEMRQRGFSLLEMIVAMAILALSLGVLYRAAGGATKAVAVDERYAYAVELAQSVLADNSYVPVNGMSESGTTSGGFNWQVSASPYTSLTEGMPEGAMQYVTVVVSWRDVRGTREVKLVSIAQGLRQ